MKYRKSLGALIVLVSLLSMSSRIQAQSITSLNETAIEAYRAGEYATAEAAWNSALTESLSAKERGQLLYNLGNAVYRQGRKTEAIAWYTSAVRATPRDAATWNNLEFVRREVQLEPADRGDLSSTVKRVLSSVDRSEAGWMAMISIALLAAALFMEAIRGGAVWKRLSLLGFVAVLVSAAPLAWQVWTAKPHPLAMVLEQPAAALRTEPGEEHIAVAQAGAGTNVQMLDELGDWVRVETELGERGWALRSSIFELR